MSVMNETEAAGTGGLAGYNFAYLDEQTKRMIRRAILKAIAIPGYQVPFASREMPMPYGWGTGGVQVTASVLGPDDILKVIDQGADDTTNAVSIRRFFQKTTGVRTTTATRDATVIQTRHRIPETPLKEDQILVYQVPIPEPLRFLEPRETETRRMHALADYGLMHVKLYEDIARHGHIATTYAYPVRVDDRYIMDPSPTPKFDNPKMDMCPALQLFGAGREKRIYALAPYTRVAAGHGLCDSSQICGVGKMREAIALLGEVELPFTGRALDILVAVENDLGIERRMRTEANDQVTPFRIHDVEVIVINIGVRLLGAYVDAALTEASDLPYRCRRPAIKNAEHSTAVWVGRHILVGHFVLAFPPTALQERNAVLLGVCPHPAGKAAGIAHHHRLVKLLVAAVHLSPPCAEAARRLAQDVIGIQYNPIHAVVLPVEDFPIAFRELVSGFHDSSIAQGGSADLRLLISDLSPRPGLPANAGPLCRARVPAEA